MKTTKKMSERVTLTHIAHKLHDLFGPADCAVVAVKDARDITHRVRTTPVKFYTREYELPGVTMCAVRFFFREQNPSGSKLKAVSMINSECAVNCMSCLVKINTR